MPAPQKISNAGLALLKAFEKCRLDSYLDSAGLLTIYWGHKVRPGERFNHSQEEADRTLVSDLSWAEDCVNAWHADVALSQMQFDALVCFTFNVGAKRFQTSTLRELLLKKQFSATADQFLRWDKEEVDGVEVPSAGLLKRRTAERALFLGLPWSPP